VGSFGGVEGQILGQIGAGVRHAVKAPIQNTGT
jgi:hypothetical protein